MAKLSIRIHTDFEEYGVPLRNSLQLTAEATEGFCSYIHGDQEILAEQYKKIVMAQAEFLGRLAQISYKLGVPTKLE